MSALLKLRIRKSRITEMCTNKRKAMIEIEIYTNKKQSDISLTSRISRNIFGGKIKADFCLFFNEFL